MCRKQPGIGASCEGSGAPCVWSAALVSGRAYLTACVCTCSVPFIAVLTHPPPPSPPAAAALGKLCDKCDGKCVICDSYVRPAALVHLCDDCNYGSFQGRCVICGGVGASEAYYCKECTQAEKDVRGSAGPRA